MSSPPARDELIAALFEALRTNSALGVLLSQAVADRVGLTPTDLETLDVLMRSGPITAGRLAELTGLTTGGVTGVVDRLERARLVRREPDAHDRRRVIVRVDEAEAGARFAGLYEPLTEWTNDLLTRYSDAELALILDFLTRAVEPAQRHIAWLRQGTGA